MTDDARRDEATNEAPSAGPRFDNRITRLLGVDIPIANAPMGGVASAELVAAMAEHGAIAFVPGSTGADAARARISAVRALTQRSFGVNIPARFSDPDISDALIDEGVRCVSVSTAGVGPHIERLKAAGITVLQAVTSLDEARRAADLGVDALIVEGNEAAALRGPEEIGTMVLLPLVTERIEIPVIAAGGIVDGRSMAAAFALGAEGVLMGTRFIATAESTVHDNYKRALVEEAGVGPADLVLVELHDCFATAELVHYDNLMLCDEGGAVDFFESGATWRDGSMPVNVSGGLESKGHPISATGIANIWEVCQHVRGEGGPRQIEGARVGLAHVIGLGSACGVHILEKSGLAA